MVRGGSRRSNTVKTVSISTPPACPCDSTLVPARGSKRLRARNFRHPARPLPARRAAPWSPARRSPIRIAPT
uniref:Predicted protein n=1 Tax=Hordeum vulgare subsp. vulgare TaxID=112509 RepID=F2CTU0_HORVV|nr:predicted protein [Hordeum vulgare subsp. vulgare]